MVAIESVRQLQNTKLIRVSEGRPIGSSFRHQAFVPDIRFAIFGPEYSWRHARVNVAGFADGSLIPTDRFATADQLNASPFAWSGVQDVKPFLKRQVLTRRYDAYIVQTPEMANALKRVVGRKPTFVVPNVVGNIFSHPDQWTAVHLPDRDPGELRLFYPANGYPHKNHRFLPELCQIFTANFHRRLRIITTLTEPECEELFPSKPKSIINVGRVPASQCAYLHSTSDGMVFPSLNETFSSAPIEALQIGKPVFAFDFPFNRNTLGPNCYYCKPQDAKAFSAVLARVLLGDTHHESQILAGRKWVRDIGTGTSQARSYFEILRQLSAEEKA